MDYLRASVYVRPSRDKRGVDLVSDVLPFGRLLYAAGSHSGNGSAIFRRSLLRIFSRRLLKPCRSRSATKGERKRIAVGIVNLDRRVIGEAVGAREPSCGSD